MNKLKKPLVLMLSLLTLLVIAPLLSSSLRPIYLYFITNLLVIALGAEAGLLSFFSKPSLDHDHKKTYTTSSFAASEASPDKRVLPNGSEEKAGHREFAEKKAKVVEKSLSEKSNNVGIIHVNKAEKVKKCPSVPSLFFIEGGDNEGDFEDNYYGDEVEEVEEEVGEISRQELFAKSEDFIGNFYKELKMQREESWKRIHGFYQRAF